MTPSVSQFPGGHAPLRDATMVEFRDVDKSFGDHAVLQGLDLRVAAGEHVTIIGPSGSGKTTILRLLMTLETVSSGVIEVDGEPLTHMLRKGQLVPADEKHVRRVRQKIGMVFQQFNLFPNMPVLRNITEAPIHVAGVSREQANHRALELLEKVNLREKADAYPSELSGGQQQRVAIARALAMDPKVLLLDEVTSALDPELVAEVLRVLRDLLATSDITILCVTHEMKFARDISDRVLMFDHGRVLEEGPPEELFTDPREQRTRDFLRAILEER